MVWAIEREIVVIGGIEEISVCRLEVAGGWGGRVLASRGSLIEREGVIGRGGVILGGMLSGGRLAVASGRDGRVLAVEG